MAHMILPSDLGYVHGSTWHKMPNYHQLDRAVTIEEADKVVGYPLEKRPTYCYLGGVLVENKDSFCIVRTDTETNLVPAVGKDFVVMDNSIFFDSIKNNVIIPNSDKLEIESVGTLAGGQICFVNLALTEFAIKGDQSKTATKVAYYNPLGTGAYKAFCATERIVCMNTLRIAEAQGAANGSLRKISHTKSAQQKITDAVVDLADMFLGIEKHRAVLEQMAKMQVSLKEAENFAKALYGFTGEKAKDEKSKARTRFENDQMTLLKVWDEQDGFDLSIQHSRYGLLQAVTNLVDHEDLRKGNDIAYRTWDGLVGNNAKFKEFAMSLLMPENDLLKVG